jgi:hypothetical protein
MQVFHHEEHRLLGGDSEQNRQEGLQGLLLLLLRGQGQGGIIRRQRQGEEGSQQGHGLCQGQAILHQEPFQFAELLLRGLLPLEAQRHALQQIDHRI